MKTTFSALFFLFCPFLAQASVYQEAGKAKTWQEARTQCENLGKGWDLPSVEDYETFFFLGKAPNLVTSEGVFNPMWVRAYFEEDNVYLSGAPLMYMEKRLPYGTTTIVNDSDKASEIMPEEGIVVLCTPNHLK